MSNDTATTSDKVDAVSPPPPPPLPPTMTTSVTVKFRLDDTYAVAQSYDSSITVAEMQRQLAAMFQLQPEFVQLCHSRLGPVSGDCAELTTLAAVPQNEFSICEFQLSLSAAAAAFNAAATCDEKLKTLDLEVFYQQYHMPEFIVVNIVEQDRDEQQSDQPPEIVKRLIVEIDNNPAAKRFVGGFFDTHKNIEFHHAMTQTGPHETRLNRQGIVSRSVQTIKTRDIAHFTRDSQYVQATQNTDLFRRPPGRPESYIRPTFPTEQSIVKPNQLLHKVIVIQRAWRRYLYHRFMYAMAAEYRRLLAQQKANHIACADRERQFFVRECYTKTYPKTREDYNVIVLQIHKWKQKELARIRKITCTDGSKLALMNNLLNEEIRLLNGVERKWFERRKRLAVAKRERNLDDMGKPIRWIGYNNKPCEIDYLRTQKVRQLVSFYRTFKQCTHSVPERLDIIDQAFVVLRGERPSALVAELSKLLDRERTLLLRSSLKCSDVVFGPLHKRQCDHLAAIIEAYGRGPNTKENIPKIQELICSLCKKKRPAIEFEQSTRQRRITHCLRCVQLRVPPKDHSVYKAMLRHIQRSERRLGALSSFAFVARVQDIADLVETVWRGQSLLSQTTVDVHGVELQLPRWRRGEDWSPWNCVLMTRMEARAHGLLKRPEELYDGALCRLIDQKQRQARLMFRQMKAMDEDLVESKRWWRAGLDT